MFLSRLHTLKDQLNEKIIKKLSMLLSCRITNSGNILKILAKLNSFYASGIVLLFAFNYNPKHVFLIIHLNSFHQHFMI